VKLVVRDVGAEAAADVWSVARAAFEARPPLDPPAAALADTVESVAAALANGGGLVAEADGVVVGSLTFDHVGDTVFLRRFAVAPTAQGQGVAGVLIADALDRVDTAELAVVARLDLPKALRFWERCGFSVVTRTPPTAELRRPVWASYIAPDRDAMSSIGTALAARLRAGDLVVLAGALGAGKTTLAQGIGAGLEVRGEVTSPTFVISRVHPSTAAGPAMVHVDTYRLGGPAELDDLDLDASLDEAVTVVEWGEGLAEGLSDSRLEVRIERTAAEVDEGEADPRRVTVRGFGPRWARETAW
jgi:tRNA threonylcarbamoyladenosine biosynthesis protein TsaE